jgi:heme/copper-type cytochrome/quinol oxidase subunit 3
VTATGVRVARPVARPNGWWGMALFLCAEVTLFGTLISSYFYLDFGSHQWPPAGIALVLAGGLVYLALRAARDGRRAVAVTALGIAFCVQVTYLVIQITLMKSDIDHTPPRTSAYASIYYTLEGASHAHVGVGLLLSLWLLLRLSASITPYRLVGLSATNLYWQVVNALTVAVLLTQISPRL